MLLRYGKNTNVLEILNSNWGEIQTETNDSGQEIETSEFKPVISTKSFEKTESSQASDMITYHIPAYSGAPFVELGTASFKEEDILDADRNDLEFYSDLDAYGRCQTTYASICLAIMPTEQRGDISSVTPTGWVQKKYDFVDGGYLYNRCHLIGYQLAGENAEPRNLITGTRSMNVDGMLPWENYVADFVEDTNAHVLYRVTPVFVDQEQVCRGVLMEGYSVEDAGNTINFCVFCYNVEPGVVIDYATGDSAEGDAQMEAFEFSV